MSDNIQMPRYKSHKEVWALKIKLIGINEADGSGLITPEDDRYCAFSVSTQYMEKHEPKGGGYYVKYEGGYESFSPADAFESGYTLYDPTKKPCQTECEHEYPYHVDICLLCGKQGY